MDLIFKVDKEKTKDEVLEEINTQLSLINDIKLADKIKLYFVEPTLHFAIWDYSATKDKYPVWLIISSGDTGILFSEYGYGFGNWGLITLSSQPLYFGPDFCWYPTLKDAFLDSWMAEQKT